MTNLIVPPSDIRQRSVVADDGERISYTVSGEDTGRTIVLISGLGQDVTSWYRLLDEISEDFCVIVVENRGVGLSGRVPIPTQGLSIERMATDVHCVIQDAVPQGVDCVVGGSMGGFIAQTLVAQFPGDTRSLVLASTCVGGGACHDIPGSTREIWRRALEGDASALKESFEASHSTRWLAANPLLAEEVAHLRFRSRPSARVWREQFSAVEDFLQRGSPAARIEIPTVVAHGTLDRVIPFENAAVTVSRCDVPRLLVAEGNGHAIWIERPELVAESIRHLCEHDESLDHVVHKA